jgi:hypothetical protein
MRGSTRMDMIVASSTSHATKHYGVREMREFSDNKHYNDSYLNGAAMNS